MIEQNKKRLTYNQFDQRQFYASMNRTFNHQHLIEINLHYVICKNYKNSIKTL